MDTSIKTRKTRSKTSKRINATIRGEAAIARFDELVRINPKGASEAVASDLLTQLLARPDHDPLKRIETKIDRLLRHHGLDEPSAPVPGELGGTCPEMWGSPTLHEVVAAALGQDPMRKELTTDSDLACTTARTSGDTTGSTGGQPAQAIEVGCGEASVRKELTPDSSAACADAQVPSSTQS